jgi:hypothetical protein
MRITKIVTETTTRHHPMKMKMKTEQLSFE